MDDNRQQSSFQNLSKPQEVFGGSHNANQRTIDVKIVPRRGIYADGDMAIALWDGTVTAKDGKPYKNTYS